jgi:hypothetical protein
MPSHLLSHSSQLTSGAAAAAASSPSASFSDGGGGGSGKPICDPLSVATSERSNRTSSDHRTEWLRLGRAR